MFRTSIALAALFCSAAVVTATGARNYAITDTFIGPSFLSGWFHQDLNPDPTHGRVNYVNQTYALAANLTWTSSDTLILRSDYTNVIPASQTLGRPSVRLVSNKQWSTAVTVLNLRHMPVGCSTWPAFWTTSTTATWPSAGEIDIIEGVNDIEPNGSTLHTEPGCQMVSSSMIDTGSLVSTDCNTAVNNNAGCQVQVTQPNNYGKDLNNVGGGWYAMERTANFINLWFWARNDPSVPADVSSGAGQVNPAHWGKPYANFVNNNCPINSMFGPNNIIINLTFCGDWAGNDYPSSCPQSCVDNVNNNPGSFANAYWNIASVRVYQPGCAPVSKKRDTIGHQQSPAHRHSWEL